jgi:hypothetical protein
VGQLGKLRGDCQSPRGIPSCPTEIAHLLLVTAPAFRIAKAFGLPLEQVFQIR